MKALKLQHGRSPVLAGSAGWRGGLPAQLLLSAVLSLGGASPALAAVFLGDPGNYKQLLSNLRPGDILTLSAGRYGSGLRIHGLHGNAEHPIVIKGPADGKAAVLLGRPGSNTVSIKNASHVVLRNLEIDGRGAFVDAVKAEGDADLAHHITLENLYIHDLAEHQQSVGISTKCPAWDWVIRGNRTERVGTGMYFGDSDGSDPFIGAVIEDNLVVNTIGYNLQIKHQKPRPAIAIQPHNDIPRRVSVFHNTVVTPGRGIRVLTGPGQDPAQQRIVANAVFADIPIQGGHLGPNWVKRFVAAAESLESPVPDLRSMSLKPVPGALPRNPSGIARFAAYPDFDRDYQGRVRTSSTVGAYEQPIGQ